MIKTAQEPLSHIITKNSLNRVSLLHPSYHHFIGEGGEFDSHLDVLLHSSQSAVREILEEQICKKEHPLVNSHHDLLVSRAFLPKISTPTPMAVPIAPKITNQRVKIKWSETGILDYQTVIGPCLDNLAARWCNPACPSFSTYSLLNTAANSTNEILDLSKSYNPKPYR